jgi:hypothetical protein
MDNETYAAAVAYMKAHGGGGGTSDYEQLSNQPQINGHTLTGNQTSADLGLTTVTITGDALVLS